MRILNLGAGGFIGSHLSERLLAEGHEVVGVDTDGTKLEAVLDSDRFTFLPQDIREPSFSLEPVVADCDLVVDLIAYANPSIYVRNPLEVFRLNFTENLKVVEACSARGRRLIQFSSSEVYGISPAGILGDRLVDRDDPALATFHEDTSPFILGPVNKHRWIYACGKQLLERVVHAYGLEGRLNYTVIRPFNFIGPRIDYLPGDGEGVPRVFSLFMEALLNGKPMQLVDGGTHRRSYTFIDDAIDAIHRIVENRDGVCDREVFNIGSGDNEVSIRELAKQMRALYAEHFAPDGYVLPELINVSAEAFYGPGYEDSDRRIPDTTKAEQLLGWKATTHLPTLLKQTMAYYVGNPKS